MKRFILLMLIALSGVAQAQTWQQKVKYRMDVTLDVQTHVLKGKQWIEYTNLSPDTLRVLYYHLYWNAFQPNSMMDVRSRELGKNLVMGASDWDYRVTDRISKLKEDETGYQHIRTLKVNGKVQQLDEQETILKVVLDKPLAPKAKAMLEADFEARVPVQIRRSGRENAEGVQYSMAQWYPKLAEYDAKGWNTTPYIGREFYGVWGDFDVNITLDRNYIIAGTGNLQNPNEIGYGYEAAGVKLTRPAGKTLTWKFTAPSVHDFVWAADPEFNHLKKTIRPGLDIHVFYKISPEHLSKQFNALPPRAKARYGNDAAGFIRNYETEWKQVIPNMEKAFPFIEQNFGTYPYKQFSFIQGGDGGMEYPMATLLKGAGEGVVYHELLHSWFPMLMSTNEALYAWIDEGFASFAEERVAAFMNDDKRFPHAGSFQGYVRLAKSDYEEPLMTHADHFNTKYGYTTSAYAKGCVFWEQMGYIIGKQQQEKMFLELYRKFRFKHLDVQDIIRTAEGVSGMQLDWYRQLFVNTTRKIDYKIDSLWQEGTKMKIRLRNLGEIPMPIDLMLTFKDSTSQLVHVPSYLAFGHKPAEDTSSPRVVLTPWKWTHPSYVVEVEAGLMNLKIAEIDPSGRLADVDRKNNRLELNW
jgi:hypothetical protein